jgi:hypothetical protein
VSAMQGERCIPRCGAQRSYCEIRRASVRCSVLLWAMLALPQESAVAATAASLLLRIPTQCMLVAKQNNEKLERRDDSSRGLQALRGGVATPNVSLPLGLGRARPTVYAGVSRWRLVALNTAVTIWTAVSSPLRALAESVQRAFSNWRDAHVTRETFAKAMGEIEALLPSAMHASLDVEMTALEVPWDPSSAQASWADSAEDRYRRMRFVTTNNNIIQVGLCLFHKGPRDTIVARPYTFFVFPGKAPCARLRGRGYQCTRSTSDGRRCGRCTGRQQSPRES